MINEDAEHKIKTGWLKWRSIPLQGVFSWVCITICFCICFVSCYFAGYFLTILRRIPFFWAEGLSKTTFLRHKGRVKVCVHPTLPRIHLCYYTGCVGGERKVVFLPILYLAPSGISILIVGSEICQSMQMCVYWEKERGIQEI